MTSIKLWYHQSHWRGPAKVIESLETGLRRKGISLDQSDGNYDYHGVLQIVPNMYQLLQESYLQQKKVLFGPNIVFVPTEARQMFELGCYYLVPGPWYRDLFCSYDFVDDKKVFAWSAGIDTGLWTGNKRPSQDCFIYVKNRSQSDLALVRKILSKFKQTYSIIEYGKYQEQDLLDACRRSKFAVLLTDTETQGIGYMQILSTNTPCYVFNKTQWQFEHDASVVCPGTSVPYFDSRCGEVVTDVHLDHFREFVNNTSKYSPRDYILENHTIEKSTDKYLEFLSMLDSKETEDETIT